MTENLGIIGTLVGLFYALVKGRQADKLQKENKELLLKNKALQEEQRKDTLEIKERVSEIKGSMDGFMDGFAENVPSNETLKREMEEADSLFHEGKYKEAYALYDKINKKALSSGKDNLFVLSLMGKGICIAMQNDYQKAIETLKIAEDYKDSLDNSAKGKLYFNLGNCNRMLKNNNLAISYYSKSLNEFPDVANVYNNRGISYADKEEYERAIQDFNKAIELNPGLVAAYNNRGLAYRNTEKDKRAIKDFNKAIELNPAYTKAYYNRGLAYYYKEEYERAIQDFNKAIELNPGLVEPYINRGTAYADKGEYGRAIKNYDKAIELNPFLPEAFYNRGAAYADKGNKKEAIKSYKKYVRLVPSKYKKQKNYVKNRIKELQKEIDKNTQ